MGRGSGCRQRLGSRRSAVSGRCEPSLPGGQQVVGADRADRRAAKTSDGAAALAADRAQTGAREAAVSEDRVREELKQVIDPELFVNIIDLGLVYAVDLKPAVAEPAATQQTDGVPKIDVHIEMTLTSPACPAGPQIIQQTHQALGRLPGVGQVNVRLVMDPPWTPDRMTEAARDQLGIF